MMLMIILYRMGHGNLALRKKGSTIPIPMVPAVPCPAPFASNLAKGMELEAAVAQAKRYLSAALEAQLDLGRGSGPMDHGFAVRGEY